MTKVTQPAPTLFLSHSHSDKRIARRLVRRMTEHGFKVWLDERELRLGETLTSSIREHIQNGDLVLVVVSQASAESKWVGLELEYAQEKEKPVVPIYIDPLDKHERFRDYLGVDATSPQAFAYVVHRLMVDLSQSFGFELPQADPAKLETGLRELAREEPDLAPLILGCLDSEGLHQESMDTAYGASFHSLDDALNALFDLLPKESIAQHAAYGFNLAGAGSKALSSWIAKTGDGDLPLVTAVGHKKLEPSLIATAINLLQSCDPPNNHALYNFISHNAAHLDQTQRRSVLRLITWPLREDTSRLADVLGWVALNHFPDAVEIQQMWVRWIHTGAFDRKPSSPTDLARYLADAHKEQLSGLEHINEALRSHVRKYLRSGDERKVYIATDHVMAAANAATPILASLLREAEGVAATAEWNDWQKRDPDAAERMEWYVFEIVKEAAGDRDWLRAAKSAKQMVEFEKRRRQILADDEQKQKDDG